MEIKSIGGYSEVGKNMTAVKVGDEVVIFDIGLHIEKVLTYEGEEEPHELTTEKLQKIGAIPDISLLGDWKDKVVAIAVSHCHLDHLGAVPHLANNFPNAPIIATPYTIEILKAIQRDSDIKLKNRFVILSEDTSLDLTKDLKLEFVHMTHSTPQTVCCVLHSKEGIMIYANDFKLDNHPTIGNKPNMRRLKELGDKGVKVLVLDSLNAEQFQKTPSEKVVREMLNDVLLGTDNHGHAIVVTTFSSHIARLNSIIQTGKRMNRKIVLLGRSLKKYTEAAEKLKIVNFSSQAQIVGSSKEAKAKLAAMNKNRDKYLIICTGNQGEPNAMLSRMARSEVPWEFKEGDHVVFSCRVIPSPSNQANRETLEKRLRSQKVRMFKDIHVSGHAARQDMHEFIETIRPQHVIPTHGELSKLSAMVDLASEMGYKPGKTVHLIQDGQSLKV